MTDIRKQVVTGVVPPQLDEALIRSVFPSVAAHPGVAGFGRVIMGRPLLRIFAPLAWLALAGFYFLKVFPLFGLARRYTVTNRRVMIQRGIKPVPSQSVPLSDIDEVRVVDDANSAFYRAATLEIVSQGKVVLTLPGVPEPQSFRHAILNASKAWVPGKASTGQFIPASAMKKA